MNREKLINGILDLFNSKNHYDVNGLIKILEDLIKDCEPDQKTELEKPRINIFYDEIYKIVNGCVGEETEKTVTALNNLFNRYMEQLNKNYHDISEHYIKKSDEIQLKLQKENKSLQQDIYILATAKAKLETKIKMNKILFENE